MVNTDTKIILESEFFKIIEKSGQIKINNNYTTVSVLPYTISNGVLDAIGVVKYENFCDNTKLATYLTSYRNASDSSCMITANRVLHECIGINITDASKWMFLGDIYNNISGTPIKLYCVDVTDLI